MRKRIFLWLAIFCCLAFTVGILAACNGGDSTQTGGQTPADSSAYAGRYYEEVNGRLDADSWIELGDDWTWVDSDTMMGTFTVDGSSIHFYWVTASEPMFDGTISDGEFTVNILGTLCKYKQGTPSADTPEEPDEGDPDDEKPEEPEGEYHTVTFDVNGGEEAVLPHEYLVGALMSLPTPTREGYRFWGWFDELGVRYDNSSVMPNEDLTLTAEWKIIVTSYEDEYIYFKPATEGKKNSESYYDRYVSSGIHHYMYLELESDSIGGPEAVGSSNNLDLASRVDMDFSVADGYTLTWYNDSGFTSINGAQRFTLGYGSNIYFLTVSEGSRVVQRYLIDFYIKYDYYISLYSNIYENESYNEENRVRVIEGEKIAFSDLEQKAERDFEFDNWVYFNYDLGKYVEFDFDVAIYKNWSLYQTFKPQTITANLNGGSMDEELLITPYTPYQQLPVPTKENYDFIGWQLADRDYFADITGYGSTTLLSDDNYFKSLKAEFRPKKYYKDVSDEGDTISFVSTIPVVFYTDESRAEIHEIYYLPTELLPYSPVPDAVPLTGDDIFLGWRSYYGTEEAEIFDFNQAIEVPTSVFPEFRAATYDSEVGIGNGYTFTSDSSFDTHHVTVWLPSSGEYILTVSGKAGISVAAYGEYEASSYTSTSSRPATIVLLCDDLSGRSATVTLKQTSGKVTLSLSGESGYSDQSQKIDPTTAKYGEFGKEVLLNARENVGGIFLGWYDEDDVQVSGKGSYLYMFTMPGNEVTYTAKWAKASVVSEDAAKGTVSQLTKKYLPGEEVSVTATTNLGYTFIGWYNGDEKVADTLTYKFEMPAEDVTYTAKWIACPVNLEVSNADAGSVGMPTTTVAGERITITATTNPGYTFIGWYKGNEQVAATPTYEFIMPTENVTYTAKWVFYTVSLEKTEGGSVGLNAIDRDSADISFDLNGAGGIAPVTQTVTSEVGLVYPEIPEYRGHVFAGWYDNSGCEGSPFDFSAPVTRDVTLYAKWISYSGSGVIPYNGSLTVDVVSKSSSTKHYYAFVPLVSGNISVYSNGGMSDTYGTLYDSNKRQLTYDDDSGDGNNFKITYSVTAGRLYYIVPAGYNSSGTTTVYLSGDTPNAGGTYGSLPFLGGHGEPIKITVGEIVELTATTNPGYTFIGWYNGEEKVSDTLAYEFTMSAENVTYTAKWIKVTVESEDTVKGTVSRLTGTYLSGEEVSITATTNPGYTFIGWYNGDERLTDSLTYEFTMPEENVTYTAKWIKVTVESEDTVKGTVSRLTGTYLSGEEVSITATTNPGYTFIGWYNGDEKLTDSLTYEFTMPEENVTYTAKWIKVTVESEDTVKGTVSRLAGTYLSGEEVSITATTNLGYTFIGWYNGDEKAADTLTYKFEMPAENVTYTAKWMMNAEMEPFVFTSTQTSLSITGVNTKDATSLTIPSYVTHVGSDAFSGCNALASIEVDVSNINYASVDGILYNKAKTEFVHIPDAITGDVEIPGGVTSIANYAFSRCSNLTSITIPDSVTSIGRSAFSGCSSLKSITIPFVGATEDGTSNTHFGYIFGASSDSYNDDYVPTSLKEVIITGGTSIGDDAFYGCSSLTSVTIGNGVTSIGGYVFAGCSGLTSVTIQDGVTSIGEMAFSYCGGLTSVTIGNGVKSIGDYAFHGCDSLVAVYYTGDMASWWSINGLDNIISSGRTWYIDDNKAAGDIVIPDGTTSIPSYAFEDCTGLTSVKIPDSVKSIGSGVFSGCTSLKSITIPFVGAEAGKTSSDTYQYPFGYIFGTSSYTGATEVKQYYYGNKTSSTTSTTYYISSSLRGVTVTGGNILYGAFYNCSMLTSVTIGNGVTSIGERAFLDCTDLESVTIGNGVTSIGGYVFAGCSELTSVTISDGVTSIGYGAFQGCASLVAVYYTGDIASWLEKSWHSEVMSSGRALHLDGTKVEGEVVIPDGMTSIPSYAFAYQTDITSVTIPDSVTSIGKSAFSGCTAEIIWGDDPQITEIGDYAFRGYEGTSITIPDSVTSIGEEAFNGCTAEIVWGDNPEITGIGAYAFSEYEGTSIAIPDSVTSIGAYAFYYCSDLTSVTIPDSVTSIGEDAFSGCTGIVSATMPTLAIAYIPKDSLQTVVLTSGESIEANAFSGCTSLTSVTIPDSVTSIGENAFSGCTGIMSAKMPTLAIAYIPKDSLQTVVLTSGESIAENAFSGCTSLTSLTIPDSVTSIGSGAFSGCDNLQYNEYDNAFYLGNAENPYLVLVKAKDTSITSVDIHDSTKLIYEYAFSGCSSLTSVTIPDSVTSIGKEAFKDCDSLSVVEITDIEAWLAIIFGSLDANPLCNGAKLYLNGVPVTELVIPDGVTSIGDAAFYGCSGLTSVIIPDSVTSIGGAAFASCSDLETVTIGSGVTSIGQGAFLLCNGLSSVTFKVKDGWRAYNNTSTSGVSLSSSYLSNTSTAASYLKLQFAYYCWERDVNE